MEVTVRGETLRLLADKAVYWQRRNALLVADTHFGKAAAFRASTIPVPRGTTSTDLSRLDSVVETTGAHSIFFLGDLLHAKSGRAPETLDAVAKWILSRQSLRLVLVRGNHDRRAGDPPLEWGIECHDEPYGFEGFSLIHNPDVETDSFALCGHIHPSVTLRGEGRLRERLPCFLLSESRLILPSFGSFTGTADVVPALQERVFVVAGKSVVEVPIDS